MMISTKTTLRAAALLLTVAPVSPVFAQAAKPVAAPAPAPAPSAWTVSPDTVLHTVEISSTAKGGAAQFVGHCGASEEPGLLGTFSHYRGGGLATDGQIERVAFYFRSEDWQEVFSVQIRYSAAHQAWNIAKPLSPVFVSSFSRGATLAVVNSRNQEILTFDLAGSTAAARAMRTVCGFE